MRTTMMMMMMIVLDVANEYDLAEIDVRVYIRGWNEGISWHDYTHMDCYLFFSVLDIGFTGATQWWDLLFQFKSKIIAGNIVQVEKLTIILNVALWFVFYLLNNIGVISFGICHIAISTSLVGRPILSCQKMLEIKLVG